MELIIAIIGFLIIFSRKSIEKADKKSFEQEAKIRLENTKRIRVFLVDEEFEKKFFTGYRQQYIEEVKDDIISIYGESESKRIYENWYNNGFSNMKTLTKSPIYPEYYAYHIWLAKHGKVESDKYDNYYHLSSLGNMAVDAKAFQIIEKYLQQYNEDLRFIYEDWGTMFRGFMFEHQAYSGKKDKLRLW